MYPLTYFNLFPPFPRKAQAFVAMSFDERFSSRWTNVIEPALRGISHNAEQIRPFRVDLSSTSDAILTEILESISDSLVIVADITSSAELNRRPVRNANVLYEVGLAHAVRLPEEVVLFRSDDHHLDFDIAGVRVHSYSPDSEPQKAKAFMTEKVLESLRALDAKRRTALRVATQQLTLPATLLLFETMKEGAVLHPGSATVVEAMGAVERSTSISLLLRLGALQSDLIKVTPEILKTEPADQARPLLSYKLTAFGHGLVEYVADEMGITQPEIVEHLETKIAELNEDTTA